MIKLRPAAERGHADHGWLDTWFSFSFADYNDPEHMGFRKLRVINDDRVAPGTGFGAHPHNDMEIVTYVLEGTLAHKDSMGNGSSIRAGEVQRMSAGTGIVHSEINPSKTEPVHLLQIWILPERKALRPGYEQKAFPTEEKRGRLRVVASPDGRDGSVTIHQDVELLATVLERGEAVTHKLGRGRHAWVQIARGAISFNGIEMKTGDGAAVSGESSLELEGRESAEVLVFDLS